MWFVIYNEPKKNSHWQQYYMSMASRTDAVNQAHKLLEYYPNATVVVADATLLLRRETKEVKL